LDWIPSDYISTLISEVGCNHPEKHCRILSLVAGTSIVADYCFWLSPRAGGSRVSKKNLMAVLHIGLNAYRQDRQDDVITVIHDMVAKGKTKGIKKLVLEHRLPKPKSMVIV